MKKNLLLAIVILLFLSCNTQDKHKNVQQLKTNKTIDSLIVETINKYNFPAITAAVIGKEKNVYGKGGRIKISDTIPVNIKNKFHLGSCTKAITSLIAMKMVENQEIELATTILDLFPEFKNNIDTVYYPVSLLDLLSHKARIQAYTDDEEAWIEIPDSVLDKRYQFAKFVLNEEPVEETETYTYSNAGYVIASLMLEKASNKSFEVLVQETLNELNLDYFIGFPNKENTLNPWGHWKEKGKLIALGPEDSYKLKDYFLAAGDISMNIVDYSKLIQLHLNGLTGTSHFLKENSFKMMHYGIEDYSLGWVNLVLNDNKISAHDGSAGTYYCSTFLIPKREIAVVIMTNSAEAEQEMGIVELRNELLKIVVKQEFEYDIKPLRIENTLILKKFVGKYKQANAKINDIFFEKGKLYLSNNSNKQELLPISDTRFIVDRGLVRYFYKFTINETGEVVKYEKTNAKGKISEAIKIE